MTCFRDQIIASFPTEVQNTRGVIDYRNILTRLEETLRPQLEEYIPRTFPEYTPHNWSNHIIALFDIAAQLFGSETLLALADVDRFLLIVGLYCHDWGMAVGNDERERIVREFTALPRNHQLPLASRELAWLAGFAKQEGVKRDVHGNYPALTSLDQPYWREYIRQTHALRSGDRAHEFLANLDLDSALCESARDICVGHWLDYEVLRDAKRFRPLRTVATQRVHVRLIALVVRLADLFDVGRDRTPYALRRFVGPADPTSIREWDKHAALDHIDCVDIGRNRWQVVIRGTCQQPSLWPALTDLYEYLRDQLEHGVDLLVEESRMRQSYLEHQATNSPTRFSCLDSTLKWEVQAEGFAPTNVRFEFDRHAVFRILAQEIYGHNPYIFIRELLQNAIDATSQLCARQSGYLGAIQRSESDFVIHFTAEPLPNGRIAITCRDYGVGMDVRILTTYLARIGSSYYTSKELASENLKLDAISRFGIGLLSCFMVGDQISIKSRRLSANGGDDQGIIVTIPSIDRHFEITEFTDPSWEGTSVRVEVLPEKIAKLLKENESVADFNIGNYLKQLAGFVRVPILVDEAGTRLLILHPSVDAAYRSKWEGQDIEIWQCNGAYRWRDELQRFIACPNPDFLGQYRVNLEKDLRCTHIEGFITFPMPFEVGGDMQIRNGGMLEKETMVVTGPDGTEFPQVFAGSLGSLVKFKGRNLADGEYPSTFVYQDGIYVTGMDQIGQQIGDNPFPVHAWINYRSEARSSLTASRTSFTRNPEQTPGWITIQARTYAFRKEIMTLRALPPLNRLHKLVALEKFLGVGNINVAEALPWEEYPVLVLSADGFFKCVEAREAYEDGFRILPRSLEETMFPRLALEIGARKIDRVKGFQGQTWLLRFGHSFSSQSLVSGAIGMLQNAYINAVLLPVDLEFVTLPSASELPQPLEVHHPGAKPNPENVRDLRRRLLNGGTLDRNEWGRLRAANSADGGGALFRKAFLFPKPFSNHFSFGFDYFNLNHPAVQWMARVEAITGEVGGAHADLGSPGALAYRRLLDISRNIKQQQPCYEVLPLIWKAMGDAVSKLPSMHGDPVPGCPDFSEFIPKSLVLTKREYMEEKFAEKKPDYFTEQVWGSRFI